MNIRVKQLAGLIIIFNIVGLCYPKDSLNVTRLSEKIYGWRWPVSVAVQQPFAYLATEQSGLFILDLSNPSSPIIVNRLTFEESVAQVDANDSLAFLLVRNTTLKILDISNPYELEVIGEMEDSFPGSWFVRMDEYLIAFKTGSSSNSDTEISVVDFSDPTAPEVIGQTTIQGGKYSFAVHGNYLYVATWSWYMHVEKEVLHVIDIADPYNPHQVVAYNHLGNVSNMTVNGDYLYVPTAEDLKIFNIVNPTVLDLETETEHGGLGQIVIDNNLLYSFGRVGFNILNLTDPINPEPLAEPLRNLDLGSRLAKFKVSDGLVVAPLGSEGLRIIDASNPEEPKLSIEMDLWLSRSDIQVVNDVSILLCHNDSWRDALGFVDISNPVNPEVLYYQRSQEHEGSYLDYDLTDEKMFSVQTFLRDVEGRDVEGYEFVIRDISNPTSPEVISASTLLESPNNSDSAKIVVDYPYAYIGLRGTDWSSDKSGFFLYVIDVQDPISPQFISTKIFGNEIRGSFRDMEMYEGTIFATLRSLYQGVGFVAIDVSNPDRPELIYSDTIRVKEILEIDYNNHRLYRGRFDHVLMYKLKNGFLPTNVTSIPITDLRNFKVMNNMLHVIKDRVRQYSSLKSYNIYDVTNPKYIREVAHYELNRESYSLNITDDITILASDYLFSTYKIDYDQIEIEQLPYYFRITHAYPNPFNQILNIGIDLPADSDLDIRIYNILGKVVASVANDYFSAGSWNFSFNPDGFSSGVYFVVARMQNEMDAVRKIVLIK
ncbi:MAG: T9SS type A sorting domain-containing protein [Candidatus Electryonea clarkiae]|nr:T9SS type A sorting domain-containing protein [Candidatus Electryonea clarkiae]MDP8287801.1 T9SS type A sorting domain-containing protein [Candidatus Electryonea clarkiae]